MMRQNRRSEIEMKYTSKCNTRGPRHQAKKYRHPSRQRIRFLHGLLTSMLIDEIPTDDKPHSEQGHTGHLRREITSLRRYRRQIIFSSSFENLEYFMAQYFT